MVDSDDNSDKKKSTRRKNNINYVENSEEEVTASKSKSQPKYNDDFEEEEDHYGGIDADYETSNKTSRASTRSKNSEDQRLKKNRPLRKSASKNLDDKENEDDYEITNIQDM